MFITIDTSAILAVCLSELGSERLVRMVEGARLLAPESVHWEVGNALSAMLRRQRINLQQAQACLVAYGQIPIEFVVVTLESATLIAAEHGLYAYDAYLLACAQQTASSLLTLDQSLAGVATTMQISLAMNQGEKP